jgi:hypothetical protein
VNMHATAAALRHSLRCRTTKLLLCAAGAAALTLTAMGPAAAGVGPIGTGSPLCNAGYTGTMTFNPALMNAGAATSETVGLTLAFSGCSGGVPRPRSGSYTATGTVTMTGANACANWLVPPPGTSPLVNFTTPLLGTVTWSPATISPSTVSFSKLRFGTGGPGRIVAKLPGPGSVVSGSYAPTASLLLRIMQKWASVASSCANSNVPFLTIVPSTSATAISQGTW